MKKIIILLISITIMILGSNYANSSTILIEGIGGLLSYNFLTPILIGFKTELAANPKIKVYGSDLSYDKLTEPGKKSVRLLQDAGIIFLDKSNKSHLEQYKNLKADVVYIATPPHTHIPLAKAWLSRNTPPKIILVEKPFTEDLSEMQEFIHFLKINKFNTQVYAFDHADALSLNRKNLNAIQDYLGEITAMTFFWVHDLSGADSSYPHRTSYIKPNERINRYTHLPNEKRQVFDSLIHFFNPLEKIIGLESAKILQVSAAQYEDCEIEGETFVSAKIMVKNKLQKTMIPVNLYAGCGIGGVEYLNLPGAHMLILHNKVGKQVQLILDNNKILFVDKDGNTDNEINIPPMYQKEMKNLIFGDAKMGHSIEYTLESIILLDKIRSQINKQMQKRDGLPKYPLGTRQNPAPTFEKVLHITEGGI